MDRRVLETGPADAVFGDEDKNDAAGKEPKKYDERSAASREDLYAHLRTRKRPAKRQGSAALATTKSQAHTRTCEKQGDLVSP